MVCRTLTSVLPPEATVSLTLSEPDPFGCSCIDLPESFVSKYEITEALGSGFSGIVFAVTAKQPQHLAVRAFNGLLLFYCNRMAFCFIDVA